MQLTDLLQFVEATLDRLSPARAQELAKQLASGEGREGVSRLAQDLVDWSQRNGDRVRELVRREVAAQMSSLGVATKADVEALETRIRRLERSPSAARPASRSAGATKSTARSTRVAAPPDTPPTSTAEGSGAQSMSKSAARKPTGRKPPAGGEAPGA